LVVLMIRAATPPERLPGWFTHARTYPIANAAGGALRALAPKGLNFARHMGPAVENALAPDEIDNASAPALAVPSAKHHGYSDSQRKALDDLVEKSR
jgi:hypothetical protein